MRTELDQAEGYRKKAAELRVMAAGDKNRETRGLLIRVAENYDQMALNLETLYRVSTVLNDRRVS